MQIKNSIENVDYIFLKMADQSFLAKIVLNMLHESQADITHNSVNRSHNEQLPRTHVDFESFSVLYPLF